ncbi:tetratricopeptide repeat protein, partial [Enterococcus faecium]
LAQIAEYGRAIEEYGAILKEFPNQPTMWMSYGHALRTAGRRAETIAAYRRAIALSPTLGEVWWSLANLKTEPFSDADVAAMRSAL